MSNFDVQAELLYRQLYRIRKVEERIASVYWSDVIKSPVHLSIGQEFVAVGVLQAVREDDVVFSNYRGHAHYMAKGGDLKQMVAELYGKASGCASGRGGSMHLVDPKVNFMGTSAIVASSVPNAVGYAQALKFLNQNDTLVVCFFGDGAVNEGVVFESLLYAKLHKLPILFVCENNGLAIHSKLEARLPFRSCTFLPESLGIDCAKVDDGRLISLVGVVDSRMADLRAGFGPVFIEVFCDRLVSHVGPDEDWDMGYRAKSDLLFDDQVEEIRDLLPIMTVKKLHEEVDAEVDEAFEFAAASEFPHVGLRTSVND